MIKQLLKNDIKDIEQTTEQKARTNAWIIRENFKDSYNLYLVDFGGYFGLSVLVYADGRRRDYISMFYIGKRPKEQEQQIKDVYKFPSSVSFAYYSDEKFVEQLRHLLEQNEKHYAEFICGNNEAFRDAVKQELANYEACITGDYTEALAALGMKFEELTEQRKKIVLEELHKQINNYA